MKFLIVLLTISLVVTGLSCATKYVGPNEKYGKDLVDPANPIPNSGDIIGTGSIGFTATPNYTNDTEKRMENVVWITPGKVNIDGLYPGAQGEYTIRIHNPRDMETVFSIYNREADIVTEGYSKLPQEFTKWVNIVPSTLVIPARSTGEVLVTVKIGLRDKASNKKYETWIGVMDESQKGTVKSEICSRWMITTR
jgi:hypothetical protein